MHATLSNLIILTLAGSLVVACDTDPVAPASAPVEDAEAQTTSGGTASPAPVNPPMSAPDSQSSPDSELPPAQHDEPPATGSGTTQPPEESADAVVPGPDSPEQPDEDPNEASDPADVPDPIQPPPPKSPLFDGGSVPTPWSLSGGTSKMPIYGKGCRLSTSQVFEAATNGLSDDTLSFVIYNGNESTLDIEVIGISGLALTATVDLKRGLQGRSYRDAWGWANYGLLDPMAGQDLPVVDGTLCFEQKLTEASGPVLAEFSLIVLVDGVHVSMGGNVLVPAEAVATPGMAIDGAESMEIDLR